MKKEIIREIVSLLNTKGFLREEVVITEDVFMDKLFINNDERKEILKGILSLFSEDYQSDLKKADNLESELAKKINELGFIKEKRIQFVMGKCTKEEQKDVYEKMFKALHLALVAQAHPSKKFSSTLLTENLFKPGIELSNNKLKKLSKNKLNLDQAVQNLKMACKTLEDASEFLDQQKHLFKVCSPTSHQNLEGRKKEESELEELVNSSESLKLLMGRHISLLSVCTNESSFPAELGTAVGELYQHLHYVTTITQASCSEGTELKKYDLERLFTQAVAVENNNCAVSKCFSKDFDGSDDEKCHEN